jgi:hypothetical protein
MVLVVHKGNALEHAQHGGVANVTSEGKFLSLLCCYYAPLLFSGCWLCILPTPCGCLSLADAAVGALSQAFTSAGMKEIPGAGSFTPPMPAIKVLAFEGSGEQEIRAVNQLCRLQWARHAPGLRDVGQLFGVEPGSTPSEQLIPRAVRTFHRPQGGTWQCLHRVAVEGNEAAHKGYPLPHTTCSPFALFLALPQVQTATPARHAAKLASCFTCLSIAS